MTGNTQTRDNQYYLERLKGEHPSVYADYQAGKFRNASEAFVAAGLRRPRSGLDLLQSAWTKATPAERDAFKVMIGCAAATVTNPVSARPIAPAKPTPVRAGKGKRHLSANLEADVRAIISQRGLKIGDVMREIGRNPLDASLGMALHRGTLLKEDTVTALEGWVARHKAP